MNQQIHQLNPKNHVVVVRVTLTNENAVPVEMREFQRSPLENHPARKQGKLFLEAKEDDLISMVKTLDDLVREDYILINGFLEERPSSLDLGGWSTTQYIVGFTMLHREFVKKEPTGSQDALLAASFNQIAEESLWRGCRGYENPCYDNDKEVEGATAVVFNFAARQPLCNRDGKPITQRPLDAAGKKIPGRPAEPVRASHHLRVENKVIRLVPAE